MRGEGTLERGNGGMMERRSHVPSFLRSVVPSFLHAIRKISGMPDYEAYLEHFRRFHPDAQLPTERQFYADFVQARYGDGPTRCC
jgi:uncharacterized short protein YbdD (DUF466 family)